MQLLPRFKYFSICSLVLTVGALILLPSVSADEGQSELESDRMKSARMAQEKEQRLREGAEIVDATGRFEWLGDRLNFTGSEDHADLKVLENRMMERVVKTLDSTTGELQWTVSGTVTEYKGSNFLLLKRVTLNAKRSQ